MNLTTTKKSPRNIFVSFIVSIFFATWPEGKNTEVIISLNHVFIFKCMDYSNRNRYRHMNHS